MIRVELYDLARRRAGVAAIDATGETLADVLRDVEARCPDLSPDVMSDGRLAPHWRVSRDGREFIEAPDSPIADGETLLILSALAGG